MDKPNHLTSKAGYLGIEENTKKSQVNLKKETKDFNINNRMALSGFMILVLIALSIVSYNLIQVKNIAFEVYIGQDKVATVRSKKEILAAVQSFKDEISNTYNMDITFKDEISFKETHVRDKMITSISNFEEQVRVKMGFLVYGYAVSVNGQEVGSLKTEQDIASAIEKIKKPYATNIKKDETLKEIRILEDIEVTKKEMPYNKIMKNEVFYNNLLTGSEEIKTHIVEVGESFWTIASIYNMDVEDIIAANPDKNPEAVQIGDEIKLVIPKSLLTVETITESKYEKAINYKTEIREDAGKYNTYKNIQIAGERGSTNIVENITRQNGVKVDTKIISENIVKKPVTEIIVKGTMEPPKTMATGAFLRPTRGRISSPYGMRNGRMHKGLDIASGIGTSIKAADGGKVVFTGYKGAYGKLVEIDHENGYKTRYAHNSKILVKVGDRVYKGQEISKMGSTGRSTGSHLHFEVIKSGQNQNPINYVN